MQAKHIQISQTKTCNLLRQKRTSQVEEKQLLTHFSQGNTIAFWQLWELHQNYLYSRCLGWMGGNATEASEALSRAMLKAWEKLPIYAEKITNLKAWLTRMTHNLCVDIHRERQRGTVKVDSLENLVAKDEDIFFYSLDCPESAVLRRELIRYICCAINNLPPRLQEPFKLHCYQQMPYKEIAVQLGISENNVYKRTQQARQILQKHLNKYFSGLDNSVINEFQPEQGEICTPAIAQTKKSCIDSINYQVTAICLETLSHSWLR